jgi:hypothetical protein
MKATFIKIVIYTLGLLSGLFVSECFGQTRTDNSAILVNEKITYETPMTYELMQIAIALTDTTIVSNGYNVYDEVINKNSDYYKDVINYFAPYKNHILITDLNKSLRKSASNYVYNVQIGCNLNLKNNQLDKVKIMPWVRRAYINLKAVSKGNIENFAKVSNFEEFYKQHKDYYIEELKTVQQNAKVNEQQKWLEKEFPAKHKNYRIIISPLMGNTHFTQRFKFQGNRNCIMWVKNFSSKSSDIHNVERARYIGTVMTEIDHNYVNPVSKKYKKTLNELINQTHRTKWTNGGASNSYKTGYSVFNEYFTHSVYLLFAIQELNDSEKKIVEKTKIDVMIKVRKFIKFAEFYEQMKLLYQDRKSNETITDFYPKIIEWCKSENLK